jgi:prophage regulatory protein
MTPSELKTAFSLPLPGRFITAKEISFRTGRAIPTIYRWEEFGTFPKRVRLGPRSVAWRGDEVQQWLEQRSREAAEAEAAAAAEVQA